jgi:ribosome biogenesis GTPase
LNQNLIDAQPVQRGLVIKKTFGQYFVRIDGRIVPCSIANKLRKNLLYSTADSSSIARRVVAVKDIESVDPIAVGDHVEFTMLDDANGMITEVLPRRNKLSRPAIDGGRRMKSGGQVLEQVIAANVDQIISVMPIANPAPSWDLLDRYLLTAEAADISPLICFTKIDLMQDAVIPKEIKAYESLGYPVLLTSSNTGQGIDAIKAALKDKVSVLWGKSGVGKTSLLNAIQPGLGLRVIEVNRHNSEGRHTTSHMEMFDLEFGGSVIDTPGVRTFKLWDVEDTDLAHFMPDLRSYLGKCRFGANCTHQHEPGCAIKEAVKAGAIDQRRYESYLEMRVYFSE